MHKVLVIEDEQSVRSNLVKILQFESFEVIEADNGVVGIKLAQEVDPDLIVCDIMMPGMDGYQVKNTLSKNPKTAVIPFIFLTAKADRVDVRLGMSIGADDYLTKPFTRDELIDSISARLSKQAKINSQLQEKLNTLIQGITESVPTALLSPMNQIQDVLLEINKNHDSLHSDQISVMTQEAYTSSIRLERLLKNSLFYALLESTSKNPEILEVLRHYRTNGSKQLIGDLSGLIAREYGRPEDLNLKLQELEAPIFAANLSKIVEELVDNAFKHSPSNTSIIVETFIRFEQFTLLITNTGIGFTPEVIDDCEKNISFGMSLNKLDTQGVGLLLARRLAELYGGYLKIVSFPNRTTTVSVFLPI